MNKNLGRLIKVDTREVWASESSGFTPWLARDENLKLLGEAIGIDLELDAQEENVGPFRADILCKEPESGRAVVIENQIEGTDHSHLGQLLTYAAGLDASVVMWIAQTFTEEHRAALDWLNEKTQGNPGFFGIGIEVWRIGDSPPAPKFNIVSKPNDWSNIVKQALRRGGLNETEQMRVNYWTALIEFLKSSGGPFRCKEALPKYWLNVQSPIPGFRCGFEISARDQYIDAYIGSNNPERVEFLRRIQQQHAAEFERGIGEKIEWTDAKESGKFWIAPYLEADPSNSKDWARQHEWLKNTLEKLIAAVSKHLAGASGDQPN